MTYFRNTIKGIIGVVACLMIPFCVYAQSHIERSTQFAFGATNMLDTYLSPLEYTGTDVRFISSVLRTRDCGWDIQYTHEGCYAYTSNPADNADAMAGHYDFAFAMMHRWAMLDGKLTLRLGGMSDFYLGFAYNMRTAANNPAQGYASLAVGGAGMATYKLKIGKITLPVTYEVRVPLIGMMFSPAYGQSYYEIFNCGNYDHNVQCFTIATPSLRHQLSVDIPVWKRTSVRVGYFSDIRQATPNHLKQHTYTHSLLVGFIKNIR